MTEVGQFINILTILSKEHFGFISMMRDFSTMVSMWSMT